MDEEWRIDDTKPVFSLIRDTTPEEEAKKDGYVDSTTYSRWKKADRRLYQKLKLEHIAQYTCRERFTGVEALSNALVSLSLIKKNTSQPDSSVDELIGKVKKMQLGSYISRP